MFYYMGILTVVRCQNKIKKYDGWGNEFMLSQAGLSSAASYHFRQCYAILNTLDSPDHKYSTLTIVYTVNMY